MITPRSLRVSLRLTVLFLILGGLLMHTGSATLVVDDDGTAAFTSIQPAIDAAIPGTDDVLVRCGTYVETIVMRDGVSVHGENARCVVLDPAQAAGPVVTLTSVGAETVLSGFTVKNREGLGAEFGIDIRGGEPVITRNIIEGGGPTVYSGAGIAVYFGSPEITYNIIRDNQGSFGGGLHLSYSGATVRSNLIVENLAYYGAGMYINTSEATISHNTIVGNQADAIGGGIFIAFENGGVVADNVIANNGAVVYGGAVFDPSGATVFRHNDFFGNDPEDFLGPVSQNGNISADPRFLDQDDRSFAGFQPRSFSPLIDAASVDSGSTQDLRGLPRPLDGNVDASAISDIGARENEGVTGLIHDGTRWIWDPGLHEPMVYDIYRGDLATLRTTGVYTQDPLTVEGARHFCDFPNSLDDADTPEPEQAFFYLPVAHGAVEGSLGFESSLTERPRTLSCMRTVSAEPQVPAVGGTR